MNTRIAAISIAALAIRAGAIESHAQSLTLAYPNGGETFAHNAIETIRWNSDDLAGPSVAIAIRKGSLTKIIVSSTPNDGAYEWTVSPGIGTGSNYTVAIRANANPAIADTSDAPFTIAGQSPPDTPAVLDPANGTVDVPLVPFFLGSDFSDSDGADTLATEQWQIPEDFTFASAVYDALDTDGIPDHQVAAGVLAGATAYFARVRYQDNAGLWSAWSLPNAFITAGEGGISRDVFLLPGGVPLEMIAIPAGAFMMGSQSGNYIERPVHPVTLSHAFQMGRFEITKAQWTAVLGTAPWTGRYPIPLGPNTPATHVSWNTMQVFCAALSDLTGETFRLPTEAEWEYACRAGSTTDYCYGDDLSLLSDYGWCDDGGPDYPSEVGQLFPNAWGLYDMHGGVREWCNDWFANNYYNSSPAVDPQGPETGTSHVFRGGSWDDAAFYCRSAARGGTGPTSSGIHMGFRVVRILAEP